jgi:AraC family transcriptional regulator of arabinose operon
MHGHIYLLERSGHIVAYRHYAAGKAAPTFSVLGLAVEDGSVEAVFDGREVSQPAVVGAAIEVTMGSNGDPVVAFVFYPDTAIHRALATLPAPRLLALSRASFSAFDDRLRSCMRGVITLVDAEYLFDDVGAVLETLLPAAPRLGGPMTTALEMLEDNPRATLSELSHAVSLSPNRLSHLFAEKIGMDMRHYRRWVKVKRYLRLSHTDRSFTELAQLAGFADVAHLSRSVSRIFGGTASALASHLFVHAHGEKPRVAPAVRSEALV